MGATLYDFRDLDLMLRIVEEDEGMTSLELAEAIGLGEEGTPSIGIRLGWMRRYGMVRFDETKRMWRLTRGGERVTEARLKAAQSRALESVPDDALVDVMAHVTNRYRHGDALTATLLRREFLFGTQRANGRRR